MLNSNTPYIFSGIILNRAICKVLLKDEDGALADFETAVALNPFAAHAYFNRANLHLTMGNCHITVEKH